MIQLIHEFPIPAAIAFWVSLVVVSASVLEISDGIAAFLKRSRR
jgi:hypothetical protein